MGAPAAKTPQVPATPVEKMPTAPALSTLRRSGLSTQLEIHDRQQVEIRFNYPLSGTRGGQRWTVDAWLFVPRNVGVNRGNYTREQFYADLTALMRLDADPMRLDRLADATNPASPLHHMTKALDAFRSSPRPPPSRPIVAHVKLFAYLFTAGLKSDLGRLARAAKRLEDGESRVSFEKDLAASLARVRDALWSYRKVRASFWPFEKLAHHTLAEAMRGADEYSSLFLEERLTIFVRNLEGEAARYDGSGFIARCRLAVAELLREEADYRRRYGYLTMSSGNLSDGEYFTYRSSLLKKAVQQALYLDPREVKADTWVRNAVASVGAALAAIWALATQLPSTIADVSGSTKTLFFTAAVVAYVLKDRIKALTSEYLGARVRRHDHTWWLVGEETAQFGLESLRARIREAMRFASKKDLPADVKRLRLTGRTVRNAELGNEEVIHYRKVLEISSADDQPIPPGYSLRDILRFNVRHFIVRLDDPLDKVDYFDVRDGAFATASLPKVYHLNLVVRATRRDASGEGQERYEHLRVILNKDGIVRVEEAAAEGPRDLPVEESGLKLPLGLRIPVVRR